MAMQNWLAKLQAWWHPAIPRPRRQRPPFSERGIMIGRMQSLESRVLLAAATPNVLDVSISSKGLTLVDNVASTAGDELEVTYLGSQVTLTAKSGTQLDVDGTLKTTHTFTAAAPISFFYASNATSANGSANKLTITGDGQAAFTSMEIRLGNKNGTNSVTMNKVVADSVTVVGRRSDTDVSIQQSTINDVFRGLVGNQAGSSISLDQAAIHGPIRVEGQTLTINQSTIDGQMTALQKADKSKLTTTASTYNGAIAVGQGADGTINVNASANGPNRFNGPQKIKGRANDNITMNVATNGAVNASTPTLIRVDSKSITPPTAPTVDSATAATTPATITGTWDSVNAKTLKVTVASKTYTLGTDAALTSPTTGKWSLSLAGVTLPNGANTVTVVNTDTPGNTTQGTGTITITPPVDQQTSIQTFLTANQLTATKTASGLNYVVTTTGTGAIPQTGQTLSVNYTGKILKSDGTLGTTFDSNVDPQFNHVQPFTFALGQNKVIAGWEEAFKLLPVGTVAKLLIPSALGYGTAGSTNIPADSILVFDVTLISAQ